MRRPAAKSFGSPLDCMRTIIAVYGDDDDDDDDHESTIAFICVCIMVITLLNHAHSCSIGTLFQFSFFTLIISILITCYSLYSSPLLLFL